MASATPGVLLPSKFRNITTHRSTHPSTFCMLYQTLSAAGPRAWNYLPTDLRQLGFSYSRFRLSLKTFLFGQWDQSAVWTPPPFTTLWKFSYLLTMCIVVLLGGAVSESWTCWSRLQRQE